MQIGGRVNTGMPGLDGVIDMRRLVDNVVWQVQSIDDNFQVVRPYIRQAKVDGRRLVYIRFGNHEPLMAEDEPAVSCKLDTSKSFYVFGCLSDLLDNWRSNMMVGNFFRIACLFLYQLDKVAFFALSSGETRASGTGAYASVVAAVLNGYCDKDSDIKIQLHGGDLIIRYIGETVYMTEDCLKVFDGKEDI